ncbi:Origin of replication complex subunit 6 [Castilleja foliolosa]|uniref:Origin of replication complex subunit 6 n=1 Tax=Castilleja foliolosa TaxID=1961234 RepID=A0ABD3D8S8_9LAMI
MMDLCFDVLGISKEKKDPKKIKGNRELLDALPEKMRLEDDSYSSGDEDEHSAYKKRKQTEKQDHDEWKIAVMKSNNLSKTDARRFGIDWARVVNSGVGGVMEVARDWTRAEPVLRVEMSPTHV